MKLPRQVHRFYAYLMGYFWLPCPLCGDCFGGHEWHGYDYDAIYKGKGRWQGICRQCAATNRERYQREWRQFEAECSEIRSLELTTHCSN